MPLLAQPIFRRQLCSSKHFSRRRELQPLLVFTERKKSRFQCLLKNYRFEFTMVHQSGFLFKTNTRYKKQSFFVWNISQSALNRIIKMCIPGLAYMTQMRDHATCSWLQRLSPVYGRKQLSADPCTPHISSDQFSSAYCHKQATVTAA